MKVFSINGLDFYSEEFLDDISEFEDIIPIVQDMQQQLNYEEIQCVGENECCKETNMNYIVEIQGFINSEDEFITKEEIFTLNFNEMLDMFVIRIYKCVQCGKWIIDILE